MPGVRVRVPLRIGRPDRRRIHRRARRRRASYPGELSELDDVVSAVPHARARGLGARARGSPTARRATRATSCGSRSRSRQVRVEKAWRRRAGADAGPLPAVAPTAIAGYDAGRGRRGLAASERLALAVDARAGAAAAAGAGSATGRSPSPQAAAHALAADRSSHPRRARLPRPGPARGRARGLLAAERDRSASTRGSPNADRYRGVPRCLGRRPRASSSATARRSTRRPHRLGLIACGTTATRCTPSRSPRACTPATPRSSARSSQGAALRVRSAHTRSVEVQRLVEIGWVHAVGRPTRTRAAASCSPSSQAAPTSRPRGPHPVDGVAGARRRRSRLGPVLVQVARPGYAPMLVCDRCREPAPLRARAGRRSRCRAPARAPTCALVRRDRARTGAARLRGHDAPRAVGRARAAPRKTSGGRSPACGRSSPTASGRCTRSAPSRRSSSRPAAPSRSPTGGYRAVLLLDGERMLAARDPARRRGLPALVVERRRARAPGAPVFLVGVGGALATALATWRQPDWARAELADAPRAAVPARRAGRDRRRRRPTRVEQRHRRGDAARRRRRRARPDARRRRARCARSCGSTTRAGAAVAERPARRVIRAATERRRPVAGRRPARRADAARAVRRSRSRSSDETRPDDGSPTAE